MDLSKEEQRKYCGNALTSTYSGAISGFQEGFSFVTTLKIHDWFSFFFKVALKVLSVLALRNAQYQLEKLRSEW